MSGRVALVGAGPGDPALLTRKAVSLLRHADLVLYDALVPAAMLRIARRARRFYVGKRAGRHSMTQDAINRLMIRAARRGDRVVRLKCGDPFVFGRGGEEAMALRAANIAVEIVPGADVSLSGAAPSSSRRPVQACAPGCAAPRTMAAGVSAGQPARSRCCTSAARVARPMSTTTVAEPGARQATSG